MTEPIVAATSLKPGSYVVSVMAPTLTDLGVLTVYPASPESGDSGQWLFSALACPEPVQSSLWALAASVGLSPVVFAPRFRETLQTRKPICVVADTSALHNGAALQLLRTRMHRGPTHFVVPDQVFMEVQRQREVSTSADKPEEARYMSSSQAARRVRASRALRRIGALNVAINHARPPEPMVRYFGGAGLESEGSGSIGPNFHRDRLIIEALREQRTCMPAMGVWLLTSDARMAAQVELEGFQALFAEQPTPTGEALILTSPWIDAYTFREQHSHPTELLEELVWTFGTVRVCMHGATEVREWTIPLGDLELARIELGVRSASGSTQQSARRLWPVEFGGEGKGVSFSGDFPAPSVILERLIRIHDGGELAAHSIADSFMVALGWMDTNRTLTQSGREIADLWAGAVSSGTDGWFAFVDRFASEIVRLETVQAALTWLKGREKVTDSDLGEALGLTKKRGASLAKLMASAGLCVRIKNLVFPVLEFHSDELASGAVLRSIKLVQQRSEDRDAAVRMDTVFMAAVNSERMSLLSFRRGLLHLVNAGAVQLDGSVPSTDGDPVVVSAIINADGLPGVASIDLATGDFLVPTRSSQVVRLSTEQL